MSADEVAALARQADAAWRKSVLDNRRPPARPAVSTTMVAVVLLLACGFALLLIVGHAASGSGGPGTTTAPAGTQAPVTPAPAGPGLPPEFFG